MVSRCDTCLSASSVRALKEDQDMDHQDRRENKALSEPRGTKPKQMCDCFDAWTGLGESSRTPNPLLPSFPSRFDSGFGRAMVWRFCSGFGFAVVVLALRWFWPCSGCAGLGVVWRLCSDLKALQWYGGFAIMI